MNSPIEIAEALIKTSGNSFHAQVAQWFQQNDWHVQVSPYYLDQSQGKAREIDLIVEKALSIRDDLGRWEGEVIVRLYVECKFIQDHSVFWFTPKDKLAARRIVCLAGFTEKDHRTDGHHYLSTCDSVAKVFATKSAESAPERDPFYKALNQILSAYVSMEHRQSIIPEFQGSFRGRMVNLRFPVVVCNNFAKLFSTSFLVTANPEPITNWFQLEVEYAYTELSAPRSKYFLIDVVAFDQLKDFCAKVLEDAKICASQNRTR